MVGSFGICICKKNEDEKEACYLLCATVFVVFDHCKLESGFLVLYLFFESTFLLMFLRIPVDRSRW